MMQIDLKGSERGEVARMAAAAGCAPEEMAAEIVRSYLILAREVPAVIRRHGAGAARPISLGGPRDGG